MEAGQTRREEQERRRASHAPNTSGDTGIRGETRYTGRCDCPCHHGTDVFHIVPCCGSLLGRRRREASG
jgi:hypothetical protein